MMAAHQSHWDSLFYPLISMSFVSKIVLHDLPIILCTLSIFALTLTPEHS